MTNMNGEIDLNAELPPNDLDGRVEVSVVQERPSPPILERLAMHQAGNDETDTEEPHVYRQRLFPVLGTTVTPQGKRAVEIGEVMARYKHNNIWYLLVRLRGKSYQNSCWVELNKCNADFRKEYGEGTPAFNALPDIGSVVLPDDFAADMEFVNIWLIQRASETCTLYHVCGQQEHSPTVDDDVVVEKLPHEWRHNHVGQYVTAVICYMRTYVERFMVQATGGTSLALRAALTGDLEYFFGIFTPYERKMVDWALRKKTNFDRKWVDEVETLLRCRGTRLITCNCPRCSDSRTMASLRGVAAVPQPIPQPEPVATTGVELVSSTSAVPAATVVPVAATGAEPVNAVVPSDMATESNVLPEPSQPAVPSPSPPKTTPESAPIVDVYRSTVCKLMDDILVGTCHTDQQNVSDVKEPEHIEQDKTDQKMADASVAAAPSLPTLQPEPQPEYEKQDEADDKMVVAPVAAPPSPPSPALPPRPSPSAAPLAPPEPPAMAAAASTGTSHHHEPMLLSSRHNPHDLIEFFTWDADKPLPAFHTPPSMPPSPPAPIVSQHSSAAATSSTVATRTGAISRSPPKIVDTEFTPRKRGRPRGSKHNGRGGKRPSSLAAPQMQPPSMPVIVPFNTPGDFATFAPVDMAPAVPVSTTPTVPLSALSTVPVNVAPAVPVSDATVVVQQSSSHKRSSEQITANTVGSKPTDTAVEYPVPVFKAVRTEDGGIDAHAQKRSRADAAAAANRAAQKAKACEEQARLIREMCLRMNYKLPEK